MRLALDPEDVDAIAAAVAALVVERVQAASGRPTGWMDTAAAAEYAGCSVHALRRAMAAGEVRCSQSSEGAKAYFRASWIDDWRGG